MPESQERGAKVLRRGPFERHLLAGAFRSPNVLMLRCKRGRI